MPLQGKHWFCRLFKSERQQKNNDHGSGRKLHTFVHFPCHRVAYLAINGKICYFKSKNLKLSYSRLQFSFQSFRGSEASSAFNDIYS